MPITGHITKGELLRFVTGTELANGFFNRFPVVAVQRSKSSHSAAGSPATRSTTSETRP
ncbi:MAG: hypothetical protein JO039_14435 [Solirubrobacterales bacterium]|nr:hypothetical protein [Solirubrobacterales bacterium]